MLALVILFFCRISRLNNLSVFSALNNLGVFEKGASLKACSLFLFARMMAQPRISIISRLLPQHLLAIDDDNALVGVADALAREVVDGMVSMLTGGLHIVDAGG